MSQSQSRMTVFCGDFHFSLIPYAMREGQSPRNILHKFRDEWIPLESGHSVIPQDVAWYSGAFVEIDAVSLVEVRAENLRLRLAQGRADLRRQIADAIAGEIWLNTESLAVGLAMDANLLGEASAVSFDTHYRIVKTEEGAFTVFINGTERLSSPDAMGAARYLVQQATTPLIQRDAALPRVA